MQAILGNLVLGAVVLTAAGFLWTVGRQPDKMTKKQNKKLRRILAAAAILLGLQLLPAAWFSRLDAVLFPSAGRVLRFALYFADYALIGGEILRKAGWGIRSRQVFDENFLMAVATLGAMALAVSQNGDYFEAIAVMLFYQVGEWFQSYAVGKSRRSIRALMDIRPDYANTEQDGSLVQVDPETVAVGSVIVIQPGEKVPIDGVVVSGSSTINTAALTGESLPREAAAGDTVLSGCINMTGVLRVRTTKDFGESTASKILDLVENAGSKKSKSENFISKFAKLYTPVVCCSALALAVLPPLIRVFALGLPAEWGDWIYRALSFLIISCPCALVISIPLSFFAGIGGASRMGILIKGSNYLETLSKVQTVVFDKTGTLTQGVFAVDAIHHSTVAPERLLEYAALAESASSHPISKSLQRAYGKTPDRTRVSEIRECSGKGVLATVDGTAVAAGNEKLMREIGVAYRVCHRTGTCIHIALNGQYAGHIVISDVVKPTAAAAVAALKKAGVRETVMLTGDAAPVAQQVAAELRLDKVYSELMPADKVSKLETMLAKLPQKGRLAFVGDGINDAPVLTRADVGIAMGALGSDAAIEAADVVLMDDDPVKIATAISIAGKCLRIVHQNIVLALGVKLLCLVLGAFGEVNLYMAIFADVGVMILAVLNAIRCLFVQKPA